MNRAKQVLSQTELDQEAYRLVLRDVDSQSSSLAGRRVTRPFGKTWSCINGYAEVDGGGMIFEFGGNFEQLTDEELKVAVQAAQAVRNGEAIAIDTEGNVTTLSKGGAQNGGL